MTKMHQWKGRLQSQDAGYPFENGPPFMDPETGAPMLPGGAQSGPLNGVDDTVAGTGGNSATVTFTGTATAETVGSIVIGYDSAGNPNPDSLEWAGAEFKITTGDGPDEMASAASVALDAGNFPRLTTSVAGGVLTVGLSSSGTIDGISVFYKNG